MTDYSELVTQLKRIADSLEKISNGEILNVEVAGTIKAECSGIVYNTH